MSTPIEHRVARNRLPVLVYVLAAGIFLMSTTEFMIAGLLPEVATDLGVDIARAGLLITAFAVGMILGPPVMALATLRLPARATLIGALAVFAAGHVVPAISDSFTVVIVSRVVTALTTGTFWATGAVAAAAVSGPGASARALAVMSGGLSLAVVAGVPLGTFAGQLTGWRGPFWMLAVLAVPAIAAVLRFTPIASGNIEAPVSVRAEVATIRPWRVWAVLAAITLAQAGFLGAYSFISPLLTDRAGIPTTLVPLVLVGFGIGALAGTTLGGRVGDRLASSLATAAFNLGTAAGSALAATTLSTALGVTGPAVLGAAITATALIPIAALAATRTRTNPDNTPARHGQHTTSILTGAS
ncbi:MFS transporter [Nocardia carnea]|uniref:MFS transporter n=1 Tax=Nocardia carnea TaxID=37328 RepID=UPI002457156A|nr:MFS transporter [Nocardia carnea]